MLAVQSAIVVCFLAAAVDGYAKGAPSGVCDTMTPHHKNTLPQNSTSPFTFSVEPKNIRPGGTTTVKLVSPNGKSFKGFFLQARHPTTNEVLGTFSDNDHGHTVDCFDRPKSALTHNINEEKLSMEATWKAPRNYTGEVAFRATFVESAFVFWINVPPAERLTVSGEPVESVVTDPPPPFQTLYDDCSQTKGCFGGPKGCIATRNCLHLIVYEWNNDTFDVDMVGVSKGWIAVGFSKDNKMGEDAVTVCAINSSNDRVSIFQTWNTEKKYENEIMPNPQLGLSEMIGSVQEGFIHCHFSHRTVHAINGGAIKFNFINESYYLFLARGMMESVVPPVKLDKHPNQPYQTSAPVNLQLSVEAGFASDVLIKLHGSLMTIAWIGTVSIAIFFARYFKQTWLDTAHCGQKVWFSWHRALNIISILLTTVGFIVIFVHLQDWSQVWPNNPHPILGVITTGLMWIQPFMAALRCHPGTPKRYIFNWFHFLVGNSAHILAVITLFFAKPLDKAKLPDFYLWILIAFVGFHVFIFFTMEAFMCFKGKAATGNQIAMKDLSVNGNAYHVADTKKDAPGSRFRKVLLSIYVFGNVCFVCSLVAVVVISPVKDR